MIDDAAFMARALLLAERGRGRTSPNPMVGALVVDGEGVIVGRGSHERAGGAHAEVHALVDAGDRARGATLYCTLEPCAHAGRTGPCAPRVVEAGIRRAVIAVEDPNPRVRGRGLQYLRDRGLEVEVGVRAEEARRLNRPFFTYIARGRPFVTLKAALSLDGMVAARRGARTALTGPEANTLVHQERAEVDALAIGSETLLVDDPLLTARGVYRDRPLVRVVFDRRLRTPPAARLFSTVDAGPVIVMSLASSRSREPARADALEGVGAQLELVEDVDGSGEAASAGFLRGALARLARREILSLVVEGGPTLHGAFWRAGLVDRVELFVSPRVVGPDGVEWAPMPDGSIASLVELTAGPVGDDVRIEGFVQEGSRGSEGSGVQGLRGTCSPGSLSRWAGLSRSRQRRPACAFVSARTSLPRLVPGDSVSVNGVCLTVVEARRRRESCSTCRRRRSGSRRSVRWRPERSSISNGRCGPTPASAATSSRATSMLPGRSWICGRRASRTG